MAFNIPDLAGTVLLLVAFAALLPAINTVLNFMQQYLGTFGTTLTGLFVPFVLLAILANIFPDDDDGA